MDGVKDYRFHPLAWREVEEADSWYLSRSYDVSVEFLSELYAAVEEISQAPQRWPKYLHGTRRFVMQRFPFRCLPGRSRFSHHHCRSTQQTETGLLEGASLSIRGSHHSKTAKGGAASVVVAQRASPLCLSKKTWSGCEGSSKGLRPLCLPSSGGARRLPIYARKAMVLLCALLM